MFRERFSFFFSGFLYLLAIFVVLILVLSRYSFIPNPPPFITTVIFVGVMIVFATLELFFGFDFREQRLTASNSKEVGKNV